MHVQAQRAHVFPLASQSFQVLEELAENALAPKVRPDVHALDPPQIAVAPIAPFVSNHQLAGQRAVNLRDEINALGGIIQQRRNAGLNASGIQPQTFRFNRQAQIKIGDDSRVGRSCLSYFDVDAPMLKSSATEAILSAMFLTGVRQNSSRSGISARNRGMRIYWVRYLAKRCGRLINTLLQRLSLPTSFAGLVKGHSCHGLSNQQGQRIARRRYGTDR
jgi:hypothetical protein